jgi:hypothetical protein
MYSRSSVSAIVQRILYVYHESDASDDIKDIEVYMLFTEYPSQTKAVLKELQKYDTRVHAMCSFLWEYSVHFRNG